MSKITMTVEGFVARDPEIKTTQSGRQVTNVSVPHTPRKRDGRGGYEDAGPTTWVQADFWDDMAVLIATTVRKGTLVRIEGVPAARAYLDKDGKPEGQLLLRFGTLSIIPRGVPQEQPQTAQGGATAPPTGDWPSASPGGAQAGTQDAWATPNGFDESETPF